MLAVLRTVEVLRGKLGAWGSVQVILWSVEMIPLRTRIKVALTAFSLLVAVLWVVFSFAASCRIFLIVLLVLSTGDFFLLLPGSVSAGRKRFVTRLSLQILGLALRNLPARSPLVVQSRRGLSLGILRLLVLVLVVGDLNDRLLGHDLKVGLLYRPLEPPAGETTTAGVLSLLVLGSLQVKGRLLLVLVSRAPNVCLLTVFGCVHVSPLSQIVVLLQLVIPMLSVWVRWVLCSDEGRERRKQGRRGNEKRERRVKGIKY